MSLIEIPLYNIHTITATMRNKGSYKQAVLTIPSDVIKRFNIEKSGEKLVVGFIEKVKEQKG